MAGLIHIYTGDGKGKTTAAIGLGIRAYGSGMKVLMVQFLKGSLTGEIKALELLKPNFELYRGKQVKGFVWNMTDIQKEEFRLITMENFAYAYDAVISERYDMIILDEIMGSISNGFVSVQDAVKLIKAKPEKLEIIMTGRNAPKELIDISDYVSEIKSVKHPIDKGIPARKGIEF